MCIAVGFVDDGSHVEEEGKDKSVGPQQPKGPKKIYIFNHLRFTVLVNEDKSK
jgi:hypothetical protein